jgi:hypothetical protein
VTYVIIEIVRNDFMRWRDLAPQLIILLGVGLLSDNLVIRDEPAKVSECHVRQRF